MTTTPHPQQGIPEETLREAEELVKIRATSIIMAIDATAQALHTRDTALASLRAENAEQAKRIEELEGQLQEPSDMTVDTWFMNQQDEMFRLSVNDFVKVLAPEMEVTRYEAQRFLIRAMYALSQRVAQRLLTPPKGEQEAA
jgi:hypothetical protein